VLVPRPKVSWLVQYSRLSPWNPHVFFGAEASTFALKSSCSFVVAMRLPTIEEMRVLSG
jgi:hypothetical protein